MRLVRHNPINELAFWRNPFDDFYSLFNAKSETEASWYPTVDILNEEEHVMLSVDLPGVKKEDISINIEDRVLTLKGERKFENEEKKGSYFRKERSYGNFKRSFSLSDDILIDDVKADFQDGVLKITLKKDNNKEEVKQITIN